MSRQESLNLNSTDAARDHVIAEQRFLPKWTACFLLAFLVFTGLAVGTLLWLSEPFRWHSRWYDRVDVSIRLLEKKRPAEVTRAEWQYVVGWTYNAEGNCIGFANTFLVERNELEAFAQELDRRIQGPVDLKTIDWIWDEFERISKYGKDYSDRWRPTRPERLKEAESVSFGLQVD